MSSTDEPNQPKPGNAQARARSKSKADGNRKARKPRTKTTAEGGTAPTKRERERYFRDLMRKNEYVRRTSIEEAAERWGLSIHTVEDDAMCAARSFEETDQEKAVGKTLWEERVRSAEAAARGEKKFEAVRGLLELEAKAKGYLKPTEVNVSGSLGDLLSLATNPSGEDPE